jgi:hypothetical protein
MSGEKAGKARGGHGIDRGSQEGSRERPEKGQDAREQPVEGQGNGRSGQRGEQKGGKREGRSGPGSGKERSIHYILRFVSESHNIALTSSRCILKPHHAFVAILQFGFDSHNVFSTFVDSH